MKTRTLTLLLLPLLSFSLLLAACEQDTGSYEYDVAVIGAGGGGLASAAALARNGLKVAVFEQHDKVGGFMTSFERDDFTFEVSLHVLANVTEGATFHRILKELDVLPRVDFYKIDPLWRCIFPDLTLDVPADREAFRKLLHEKFPQERAGIDNYFKMAETVYDEVLALGALSQKSLPVRLFNYALFPVQFPTFYKHRNSSLKQMMDEQVKDPRLQGIFAQLWGYLGLPPSQASGLYYAMMWHGLHQEGAYYPKGTSQAVSNALAAVIQENGGQIFLNTRIDKILMQNGNAVGVKTAKGEEHICRFVVSNASALQTYLRLVGEEHLKPKFVQQLKDMEISCSLLIVYLGLDMDIRKTDLKGVHEVFINSGYDYEKDYQNLQAGNLDDPHIVMGLYSNLDSSFAPEGKSVVTLVTVMPYEYQNNWLQGGKYEDYVKIKEEAAWKLIRRAEAVLPGIGESIEVMEVGTPRTVERYTLHDKGAVYGFALTPGQSFTKRLEQKGPIRNLYLAGGWTFPGNGQSSSMMSGYIAAQQILGRTRR